MTMARYQIIISKILLFFFLLQSAFTYCSFTNIDHGIEQFHQGYELRPLQTRINSVILSSLLTDHSPTHYDSKHQHDSPLSKHSSEDGDCNNKCHCLCSHLAILSSETQVLLYSSRIASLSNNKTLKFNIAENLYRPPIT